MAVGLGRLPGRRPRFLAALLACAVPALAQAQRKVNPLAGNPAAIREGKSLFRGNCGPCHGLDAHGGGRGPDLASGRWTHGSSDGALFQTITQGIPGTEMPANSFEDSEVWALIAYLRSVAAPAAVPVKGSAAAGERIFFGSGHCSQCHMVHGRGGSLGPELSRVSAARSLEYLVESIRQPDKDLSAGPSDPNNHYGMPMEYDTVVAVTKDGKRFVGVAKNEDPFSLQLLGQDQQLHLFLKKDLAEVRHERRSLMPAYSESVLDEADLQNLVAYLSSLRGEE